MKKGFPRTGPLWVGLIVTVTLITAFNSPEQEQLLSPGGDREMHEGMACEQCHQETPGTLRQQVQANVHHWLGFRESGVGFITDPVGSEDCQDCHEMPGNLHPIHRFAHSEYFELREILGQHECSGCHDHHSPVNVVHSMTFCMHCHETWGNKPDTITPRHTTLIAEERWETCLQCHEFHGSRGHQEPTLLSEAFSVEQIQQYLDGNQPAPYSGKLPKYPEERKSQR